LLLELSNVAGDMLSERLSIKIQFSIPRQGTEKATLQISSATIYRASRLT
jgi:hypothetical protein